MKINESTLVAFATSNKSDVDKQGWLWKKGEMNRAFQKRWFVLKGNLLFYFEKQTDKEPIGVIILEGCVIDLAEEDQERFGFKISFQGERTRTYHLGTEFQQTLVEWMKMLACASHDYMKLMVWELEQKLVELENMEQKRRQLTTAAVAPSVGSCASTISSSRSANAISSLQPPTAVTAVGSSSCGPIHQSTSSQSLKSMPPNYVNVSKACSSAGSVSSTNNRPNPFNSGNAKTDEFGMPVFNPSDSNDLHVEEVAREVLAPDPRPNANAWSKYHTAIGKKIMADQVKWYQSHCSKHQLVDVNQN